MQYECQVNWHIGILDCLTDASFADNAKNIPDALKLNNSLYSSLSSVNQRKPTAIVWNTLVTSEILIEILKKSKVLHVFTETVIWRVRIT